MKPGGGAVPTVSEPMVDVEREVCGKVCVVREAWSKLKGSEKGVNVGNM